MDFIVEARNEQHALTKYLELVLSRGISVHNAFFARELSQEILLFDRADLGNCVLLLEFMNEVEHIKAVRV
jgi:hypothetical protein